MPRPVCLTVLALSVSLGAAPPARRPPHQRLSAPPPAAVRLDDCFWAPRIRRCRTVTLPHCYAMCKETGRIDNFLKAARLAEGPYRGAHFNDSDVYKIVEGTEWALAGAPDAKLENLDGETVRAITRAQDPDGYLDTFFTISRRGERFRHIHPDARHELYCMGHAIEAAATRFELSGKRDFLECAERLADHIASVFGPGLRRAVPEHQELELALIKLYRVTGKRKYLDLASFFIEERGRPGGRRLYGAYSQDHLPVRSQAEAVGHAVRAMYHLCGIADLYSETGDPELLAAVRRMWESAAWRKMYVTGGVGATAKGEAFGSDYDLPNETAYAETCAQIGLALLVHRMFLIDPRAEYADVLERVLYNGFLSGISLSGDRFFYRNLLASRGAYRRQPWYGCACCPSNVVRLLPRIGQLVYAISGDAVYVNLYAAGEARLNLDAGPVTIRQETRYPWDGDVRLAIRPRKEQEFSLHLRIPVWCRGRETRGGLYRWEAPADLRQSLSVNGETLRAEPAASGYAVIRRRWKAGDVVELKLPMPVLRVRAHRAVAADRGRVALQRGPLVYCLEAVDHDVGVRDIVLPPGAQLGAEHRPDLLGGVTVLRGEGRSAGGGARAGRRAVEVQAIPYFAWDNRAGGDMVVWMVEDPDRAGPWKTASWVGSNYTPAYCVNQVQMWHDFRPDIIEKELASARKFLGLTTLRVFLHNIVYDAENELFLSRIERFLSICARHGIRPGFVFFDDCHRHHGITLEPLPAVKGYHNGRWAACPQDRDRKEENLPRFRSYVQDVIRAHRNDPRVMWWEIFNEPNMRSEFSVRLRRDATAWARELEPVQPVLCCWDDSPETDIVDAHRYNADFSGWDRQTETNLSKGCLFTEAGARWYAGRPSSGEPCEVVRWLTRRKLAGQYVPGVCLCWELMVGNSNCRWYWGTKHGTAEPPVPWCGLLWPDGTPVSLAEAEAIRRYTTGERRALLFDDFESAAEPSLPGGWTAYGGRAPGSGVLRLPPGRKVVAGDSRWSDYVLEARVMLRGQEGNAGVIFRVNEPGPGADAMRGYYAGFDTRSLYLGRMNGRWRQLAAFDLGKLECGVVPGAWNLIRVVVKGPRIRVWFDRMHHDDGLRIDFTDSDPVPAGSVGLRAHAVDAWFDNVVVLPVGELPGE